MQKYSAAGQTTDVSTIRRIRTECWITKATNTHSEYVIIIAFPRQQWLRESASVLTFIRSLPILLSHYVFRAMPVFF